MAAKWSPKDPNDVVDYWFDWGSPVIDEEERFLPEEEIIVSSQVSVPDDIVLVASSHDNKTVRARFSGGSVGLYDVDCLITTDLDQQFEMTGTLTVAERKK